MVITVEETPFIRPGVPNVLQWAPSHAARPSAMMPPARRKLPPTRRFVPVEKTRATAALTPEPSADQDEPFQAATFVA